MRKDATRAPTRSMQDGINRRELSFKALAGLVGGAIGWLPVELTSHGRSLTEPPTIAGVVGGFISMALVSGLIGGLIIAAETQQVELNALTRRRFTRGFVICLVLSLPANYYSNLAFSYILEAGGWGINQPGSLLYLVIARLVGWTLMGAMLGAGVGLASFSLGNVLKGAAGGWVGGFVGGVLFDMIGAAMGGLVSRLAGFSAVGLAIGLFIGLVQELTKAAWLKVEAGRLRGREYRLDRAVANLGRAEESEVGLFGDLGVVARHARIERRGSNYVLKDLSIREGTFLNGERIESAPLREGDRLRIGGYELVFHLRRAAGASAAHRATAAPAEPRAVAMGAGGAAAPAAGACLVDPQGRRYPLRADDTTTLGRALDNDIVLEHASISRHHAAVVAANGSFRLRDLDSQNGTYVAGRRISEAAIGDGDSVRLGDAEFTFRA